jgi:hypothetical protein
MTGQELDAQRGFGAIRHSYSGFGAIRHSYSSGPAISPGRSSMVKDSNPLSNDPDYRYVGGGLIECPDGIRRTEKEAKKYAAGKKERDRLNDRLNRVF